MTTTNAPLSFSPSTKKTTPTTTSGSSSTPSNPNSHHNNNNHRNNHPNQNQNQNQTRRTTTTTNTTTKTTIKNPFQNSPQKNADTASSSSSSPPQDWAHALIQERRAKLVAMLMKKQPSPSQSQQPQQPPPPRTSVGPAEQDINTARTPHPTIPTPFPPPPKNQQTPGAHVSSTGTATNVARTHRPTRTTNAQQQQQQEQQQQQQNRLLLQQQLQAFEQLPFQKWQALQAFHQQQKWPYPPDHVGYVDRAVANLYDDGEPSFVACWQYFRRDMGQALAQRAHELSTTTTTLSLYQAILALLQLTTTPRYAPFGIQLWQLYSHDYGIMDPYGDIWQLFSQYPDIDLTDFESFPWSATTVDHDTKNDNNNNGNSSSSSSQLFHQALAVARALHYYIDLGFHRVPKPALSLLLSSQSNTTTTNNSRGILEPPVSRNTSRTSSSSSSSSLSSPYSLKERQELQLLQQFPDIKDPFLVSITTQKQFAAQQAQQQQRRISSTSSRSAGTNYRQNNHFVSLRSKPSALAVVRSVSEVEFDYRQNEKKPWESWYINPHRVGLGISNAMSQLCYDRTRKAWRYDYGEWVEIRNYKMKWRLTQVTERLSHTLNDKVIRTYDTHSDWDQIYDCDQTKRITYRPGYGGGGGGGGPERSHGMTTTKIHDLQDSMDDEDQNESATRSPTVQIYPRVALDQTFIRLPQEALVRIYGIGPWIWQRWACLQLELVLRFSDSGQEHGHRNDFMNLDIGNYALELWTSWLYHPQNAPFRHLYEITGPSGQEELLRHVMDPFTLMHTVVHNTERWDFNNAENISVFLYTAMLGAGFFDAGLIIFIQIAMPLMLYFLMTDDRTRDLGETPDERPTGTRMMVALALLYYAYKISRDLRVIFMHVMDSDTSMHSRLLSICRMAWDEGVQTRPTAFGYILEILLNSGYVVALYIVNVFVLYNSSDAFEVLGNVVLFEFVSSLDESVASTGWWDEDRRYLKAGTVEMLLSIFIRGQENHNIDTFVDHFKDFVGNDDIGKRYLANIKTKLLEIANPKRYRKFLYRPPSSSRAEGRADLDEDLLPLSQRIRFDLHDCLGPDPPAKQSRFGPTGLSFITNARTPLFQRHVDLRFWKLWSKILFVAPPLNRRPASDFECPRSDEDDRDMTGSPSSGASWGESRFSTPQPPPDEQKEKVHMVGTRNNESLHQQAEEALVANAPPAANGPVSLSFPWETGTKGPIVARSFKSPGSLQLNSFTYPSSSEHSSRYLAYRSQQPLPWSQRRHLGYFDGWKKRIHNLMHTDDKSDEWSLPRFLFVLVTLVSWFVFYLFLPAILTLLVAVFSPFYCMVNNQFSGEVNPACWGF